MPLKVSDGIGAYIDDFKKSDAPQFKGKSNKERRDQAIAAYLSAKKGPKNEAMSPAEKAAHDRAIAAFKKRGGKVQKLKPGYAQGYHGKDDPGKGVAGMLKRPDTDKFGTRKKIKSMSPLKMSKEAADLEKAMTTEVKQPPKKEVMKVIGHTKNAVQGRAALRKKYGVSDKEADDIIHKAMTEVSGDTLRSYMSKASDASKHRGMPTRKVDNRYSGVAKASKKLDQRESTNEETNFAVSIEGLPTMFMTADSPGMLKQTLRKIVKQPSMIQGVKRVTDAAVKKSFRLKAQGRDEEDVKEEAKMDYGSDESVKTMRSMTPGQKKEYHHPQPKQPGLKKVQELLKKSR